jgi:tRNA pseudouridine55 synthase
MKFGNETTTQDSSGEVTITTELPTLSKAEFCAVTEQFIGEIQQVPPMYSAIKKDGQPLYKLAREGVEVEIEPRPVMIHGIKVLMYNKESAMLEVHCGKGTYIRTLCQDLARACGSSAHMTYLMRLSSGDFNIADAVPLARLEQSETPEQFLQGMNDCLHAMPAVTVTDKKMMERIVNGLSQKAQGAESLAEGTVCRAVTQEGMLLAIGTIINQAFQPNKVFKCGE